MATTLNDIHPDILRTHILPRLDGPSLSATATATATATASSHLKTLCSDDNLWSQISRTTWPSITHPRVDQLISTFPAGHRSFFDDSFPALTTDAHHPNPHQSWSTSKPDSTSSSHTSLHEFISAVDIRYQNQLIYSKVNVTKISSDLLSSAFCIELNDDNEEVSGSKDQLHHRSIDLTVDEIAGADKATLCHLKESLTLHWILIDPTQKRACNLSSIKPVTARQDWVTNETVLRYITVLPGCDPNEVVKCRIQVVLGVGEKGVGLYVKEVVLRLQDLDGLRLNGMEFVAVVAAAMAEENRVRRRVVDDEQRWRSYMAFKEMKRKKKVWQEKRERRTEVVVWLNYVAIFVSFFSCVYFLYLLLV